VGSGILLGLNFVFFEKTGRGFFIELRGVILVVEKD
jgi:hypothetical protein